MSRSGNEFYNKLSILVEEGDETLFWLELLAKAGLVLMKQLEKIMHEAVEIIKITPTARKNIQTN